MAGWRIALWILIVALAIGFLYLVRGILLPFVLAAIVAVLLEPGVRQLQQKRLSRGLSVTLVFGAFGLAITLFGLWITPQVGTQVANLGKRVDLLSQEILAVSQSNHYFLRWNPVVQAEQATGSGKLDRFLSPYAGTLERLGLPSSEREIMSKYVEPQRGQIASSVRLAFTSFLGFLTNLGSQLFVVFLVPLLVFFMLMDGDSASSRIVRLIPPSIRPNVTPVLRDVSEVFSRYLRGMSKLVVFYMLAAMVLFTVLQAPYAVLFGILAGCLYLIPFVGNYLTAILILLVTGFSGQAGNWLFQTGSPWTFGIVVALSLVVLGLITDNLIVPRLVGGAVGLTPVASIFVSCCGGALFGLPGLIMAFPVAGMVKVVLDRLLNVASAAPENVSLPSLPLRHRGTA